MPKLWDTTIEAHRHAVGEAIMDTTWALVAERGLLSVTMSQIAAEVGIGRATLYKYFPDVEAILLARHARHVDAHLESLRSLREQPGTPVERLRRVLLGLAQILHHRGRHGAPELGALVHKREHIREAEDQIRSLIEGLIAEAVRAGEVRDDIAPAELANYCTHALTAAEALPDPASSERLVTICLQGLRATRE